MAYRLCPTNLTMAVFQREIQEINSCSLDHKTGCLSWSSAYAGIAEKAGSHAHEGIDFLSRARTSRQKEFSSSMLFIKGASTQYVTVQIKGESSHFRYLE